MDRQALIDRFEQELGKVQRPGMDKLLGYIRKSDFYTAPASTIATIKKNNSNEKPRKSAGNQG